MQLQAWGTNASEFASVGRALHALDKRVVVKLPITLDGVKAAKVLHNSGISVTLTGARWCAVSQTTAAEVGFAKLGR